ncbi:MAG: diaminopimelate epimerase [Armatimonadetes bacterium]|nr:diaminopimelate epimerase [Armatimonadota bacterium]
MRHVRFWKTETIGNDFVLVRAEDVENLDLPALAVELCARRTGIGSDGLLTVARAPFGAVLRMFNPDGTEDFCGNGLRCTAAYVRESGWTGERFQILHGGRRIEAWARDDGTAGIELPPADFSPEAVPVLSQGPLLDAAVQGVVGTAVSTGTAHFVVVRDELPGDEEFDRVSPLIERDPLFPEHTSVMFVRQAGPKRLELRIWERGAGETLGCGTGSAAAAVVVARKTGTGGRYTVVNPGGELEVCLDDWTAAIVSESRPVVTFTGTFVVPVAATVPTGARARLV